MLPIESVLLTRLGLAIGVAAGRAMVVYFHHAGFTFPGMRRRYGHFGLPGVITPKISFASLTRGPAVIFVFTIAAALYPARRLRKPNAVEAMHAV